MEKNKQDYVNWRVQLEYKYALICKFCLRKVMDPDKGNINQIFTKSKCPNCCESKETCKQKK